jgi:hypothetical protein
MHALEATLLRPIPADVLILTRLHRTSYQPRPAALGIQRPFLQQCCEFLWITRKTTPETPAISSFTSRLLLVVAHIANWLVILSAMRQSRTQSKHLCRLGMQPGVRSPAKRAWDPRHLISRKAPQKICKGLD